MLAKAFKEVYGDDANGVSACVDAGDYSKLE
jgi:hypothetical protein